MKNLTRPEIGAPFVSHFLKRLAMAHFRRAYKLYPHLPRMEQNMAQKAHHHKEHRISRTGWLRAAVLGANDGILSTASLILGVASAFNSHGSIIVSGVSGLAAGALSMAAGEYVSVSSQSDTENAAVEQERQELAADKKGELHELAQVYVNRGLTHELAAEVAKQLTAKDALGAHIRDELGISNVMRANPIQAATASALSFSTGAMIPLLTGIVAPIALAIPAIYISSLLSLAVLGALGAATGGAPVSPATIRVTFWGAFAMAITTGIGLLFHLRI